VGQNSLYILLERENPCEVKSFLTFTKFLNLLRLNGKLQKFELLIDEKLRNEIMKPSQIQTSTESLREIMYQEWAQEFFKSAK